MTLSIERGGVSGSDFSQWLSTLSPEQKILIPNLASRDLKVAVSAAEAILGRKIKHEDPQVKDFFASRDGMTAENFAALLVLEHQIESEVDEILSRLGPTENVYEEFER